MSVRVLVCPDKFASTLRAEQAGAAIRQGWSAVRPRDDVIVRPLSDGGPGFLDAIAPALGGRLIEVPACDPVGRPVPARVLVASATAYLESADTCGSHLLDDEHRRPTTTTSYGLGLALLAAVELGVREVVVGLGGSATNDGGAGMLAALGAAPLDAAGYALPYGGAALLGCHALSGEPRLRGVSLVAATDVDAPLVGPAGASVVFGPQKGATAREVPLLDAALGRWAVVLESALPTCPRGLAVLAGAGAAGGIGGALLACGARRQSGFTLVAQLTGLPAEVAQADLVITGEGRFDAQSRRGKVVGGVLACAGGYGRRCLVVAGTVEEPGSVRPGTVEEVEIYSLAAHAGSTAAARQRAAEVLADLVSELAGAGWPS